MVAKYLLCRAQPSFLVSPHLGFMRQGFRFHEQIFQFRFRHGQFLLLIFAEFALPFLSIKKTKGLSQGISHVMEREIKSGLSGYESEKR